MNIRNLFILLLCGLCGVMSVSCSDNPAKEDEPTICPVEETPKEATDMVLIYGGGHQRTPYTWDKEQFKPYVVYTDKEDKPHWLFDSFLFIEFVDNGEGGTGRGFAQGHSEESARQSDWEALIDYFFQSNTGLDALNQAIEESIATLGRPDKKRQVVITIPEPIGRQYPKDGNSSTTYWGKIDGRTLDFFEPIDRVAACRWYIDRVCAKFKEKGYKNIELAGFYWLPEQSGDSWQIMNDVATYLHELKYTFNWIPYYNAPGHNMWNSFGFDNVYYQPNYFFHDELSSSRLDDACKEALQLGISMELEFDNRAFNQWGKGYKLREYMEAFKKYGFWEKFRLAYYQGRDTMVRLKISTNEEERELYHDFCQFVISRPIRSAH